VPYSLDSGTSEVSVGSNKGLYLSLSGRKVALMGGGAALGLSDAEDGKVLRLIDFVSLNSRLESNKEEAAPGLSDAEDGEGLIHAISIDSGQPRWGCRHGGRVGSNKGLSLSLSLVERDGRGGGTRIVGRRRWRGKRPARLSVLPPASKTL